MTPPVPAKEMNVKISLVLCRISSSVKMPWNKEITTRGINCDENEYWSYKAESCMTCPANSMSVFHGSSVRKSDY